MHKYKLVSKKGEGTFSEVLKAQSIKTGKQFAIKCMKNLFDNIDQVNNLREIQALRRLAGHPNIIKLHEVLYDEPTGRLALVFELMDMNLYETIKGRRHYLPESKVKAYMYDLMKGLDHMHRNGIFHRDVKPENMLLLDDEVKLADLGSCRGIYSRQPYTEYISTRWYRAPECLLTDGFYNFKMDLFAAGCVWFEIVALFPLFPGQNEMDQIQKIHNVLGTPDAELVNKKFKKHASHMDFNFPEKKGTGIDRLIPHAEPEGVELIKRLIKYDPDERALARQVLKDGYFRDAREAEKERGPSVRRSSGVLLAKAHSQSQDCVASPCSSSRSVDNSPAPEVTHHAPNHSDSKERSGGLPHIRQDQWKADEPAAGAGAGAGAGASTGLRNVSAGGAGGAGGGGGSGTEDEIEDTSHLPPIASFKSKKVTRIKASKSTGHLSKQASLPTGSMGSSKGFGISGASGTGASRSQTPPTGAPTQASSYPWAPTGPAHEPGRDSTDSQASAPQLATSNSSAWAHPFQPQKFPAGPGGARSSHKGLPKDASSKRR